MARKILAAAAVLAIVAVANADGIVSLTETWGLNLSEPLYGSGGGLGTLPDSGQPYYNFRILVDVGAGDDWTAISTQVNLTNGTFYQHIHGGDVPPPPTFFHLYPDVEYDSYFTSPREYPNSTYGSGPSFALGPIWTSMSVTADFFDTTATPGAGQWYLGSLTILTGGTSPSGTVSGVYTMATTGGFPWAYSFNIPIPEPSSLVLLSLAGLVTAGPRR